MKVIPWEVDAAEFSDAYIAGFFDADGSLVATLAKNPSKYSRVYRPRIKLNFTQHIRHVDVLHRMQAFLGAGSVYVASSHNQAELVVTNRADIEKVLHRMLPHLVFKKQQALLANEILSHFGKNTRTNRISEEAYQKILSSINTIRSLNSGTGKKRESVSFDPVTTLRGNEGVAEMQ